MRLDFTSDELMEYRTLELLEGVQVVKQLLQNETNPDYVRGAMAMLKKIIRMPVSLAKSPEQKEIAQALTAKAMELFEKKLLRSVIEDE